MYPGTEYMPGNVILNMSIVYSEYLDYFHIELHFISVGIRRQILLTKQAYCGVLFCSNWLNVLRPMSP